MNAPDDSPPTTATRRPGRPRSARAERAIHDATLQLLVEQGFEGMSIEAVAARAGVGKTTIYRRYDGKAALVAAALRTLNPAVLEAELPDTGSVRGDIQVIGAAIARSTLNSVVGLMIVRVLSAAVSNPEMQRILFENLLLPRRMAALAVLRRGVERGELRADLDLELALDMLGGAIIFRVLFGGASISQIVEIVPAVVDTLLLGAAPQRDT